MLNISLSDGIAALDIFPIGVVFYWLAIIVSLLAIAICFKNMALNIVLVLLLFLFWGLDELIDNTLFFFLHILSTSILFAISSILTIIHYPRMLKIQMMAFLVLSVPIMFLQVIGISETVHVLNTLFYEYDADGTSFRNIQLTPVLFKNVDEFVYHSAQGRPPGLFYSNAILSPVVLGCSAFFLGMTYKKDIVFTDVILCMAVVLVMSKVSVVVFFIMLFWAWKKCRREMKKRYRSIFYLICIFYFVYWIFLPGLFINNLSLGAFYSSSYYRLIDVYIYFISNPEERDRLISFMSNELSFNYLDEDDIGSVSGMSKLAQLLPFIIIIFLFARKWLVKSWVRCKELMPRMSLTAQLMLITLLICTLATPLFKAPSFGYFAGIAALPFSITLSSRILKLIQYKATNGSQRETFV